jgi:ABC-2 type transport system ATP-binding protein
MKQAVIQLNKVNKFFGKQQVLCNLDWQVPSGKVIGLLGRNGAGKSTLLECILGLREINSGSITLFTENSDNLSDATRARIGYVPQQSELFDWFTGAQMLAHFKTFYPRWNNEKVDSLLRNWDVDPNKKISHLSVGQKQKLSIIRALAHEPDLLILDEPVASLDPLGRREFLQELIRDIVERESTVLFSTHILSDLERVAMNIAFLRDGNLVLEGELDQLLESIFKIEGSYDDLQNIALPNTAKSILFTNKDTHLLVQMTQQDAIKLQSDKPQLKIENMNLEDLFIEVTK